MWPIMRQRFADPHQWDRLAGSILYVLNALQEFAFRQHSDMKMALYKVHGSDQS